MNGDVDRFAEAEAIRRAIVAQAIGSIGIGAAVTHGAPAGSSRRWAPIDVCHTFGGHVFEGRILPGPVPDSASCARCGALLTLSRQPWL